MSVASVVFSIPSPSRNSIGLGDFRIRAYGLMFALGVVVGVRLAQRRWRHVGGSDEAIASLAAWAVPAWHCRSTGVSRRYRLATLPGTLVRCGQDLGRWPRDPGGLVAGIGVGYLLARRRGLRLDALLAAVVPAIPLAQAIGRLGNWFNQELFGGPTTPAWALQIDPGHRPIGYAQVATFHPTFLYEALWNILLMAVLIVSTSRYDWARKRVLALYVLGYGVGRLGVESLRIDHASIVLGMRINVWTSLVAIGVASALLARPSPLVRRVTTSNTNPDTAPGIPSPSNGRRKQPHGP